MYRAYWIAWGVLLTLTIVMVALDQAGLPRGAFLAVVLSAMLIKATLIGFAVICLVESYLWRSNTALTFSVILAALLADSRMEPE